MADIDDTEKCELVCVCDICGHPNNFDITEKEIIKANNALRSRIAELELENARLRARCETYERAMNGIIEYRKNNTLNFQLEKLDDYLRILAQQGDSRERRIG